MSLGPYIKINPNERPTEYLRRVKAVNSDGGTKVTNLEAREGYLLLETHKQKRFAQLTRLSTDFLLREVRAIKKIQKLSTQKPVSPAMLGISLNSSFVHYLVGACVATIAGIWLSMRSDSSRIDALEIKLNELDAKLAKGEIKSENYLKERRKIIEDVFRSW